MYVIQLYVITVPPINFHGLQLAKCDDVLNLHSAWRPRTVRGIRKRKLHERSLRDTAQLTKGKNVTYGPPVSTNAFSSTNLMMATPIMSLLQATRRLTRMILPGI